MAIFKLSLKLISRSLVYILYFCFILAVFLFFIVSAILDPQINYINFSICLHDMNYLGVAILIMSFCMAVYFAQKDWILEAVGMASALRTYLVRYLVLLLLSHIILLPLLIYVIVMAGIQQTELLFSFSAFAVTGLRWSAAIMLGESLGYLAGVLCKQLYVQLLAIPCACLFSMLNTFLFSAFRLESSRGIGILAGLLSTQTPFPSGMELDYTGLRLDRFFLSEMLFKLLLTVCLTLFIVLAVTRIQKPRHRHFQRTWLLSFSGSVLLLALSVSYYASAYPTTYSAWEKLYSPTEENQGTSIQAVSGSIDIGPVYKANCSVVFDAYEGDSLSFRLDSAFQDLTISRLGEPLSYVRDGDDVTVYLAGEPGSSITLEMEYSGYVYYLSNTDNVDIFSSASSAALPAGFAFLPQVDDGASVSYDLTISSKNTVISNLDTTSVGKDLYAVSGYGTSICLFAGYFEEVQIDGKTCYRAKYNVRTDYEELYEQMRSFGAFLDAQDLREFQRIDIFDEISYEPSKVFFIYYFYETGGLPICIDNSIFMNYGYIT